MIFGGFFFWCKSKKLKDDSLSLFDEKMYESDSDKVEEYKDDGVLILFVVDILFYVEEEGKIVESEIE